MTHQAGAYPDFLNMNRLEVFLLPPGVDSSPLQGYLTAINFAGTHLYTWIERSILRVNAQRSAPAEARTQAFRSGVQRTQH